jgi:tetratricopeptide (TPR) repeat protein
VWIAWELEEAGYRTVVQAWDFAPGANFMKKMHQASERCHAVVAVLSERYLESVFAGDEWTAGFRDRKLLPVRVGGDRPGGLLGPVVSIDLVDLNEDTARKRLLEGAARFLAIQRGEEGRAKPNSAPPFPRPVVERPVSVPAPFPGTGLRHLPRGPKPNFTGRELQLDEIAAKLAAGERTALTGLGGLGKSRLAIEYAHRHAADYGIIWWLRAETGATLIEDLASLATALGLASPDAADLGEAAGLALRRLEGEGRWLLIFDDAPGPDEIDRYLPKGGGGHVMVTSRELAWRELALPLQLPTLAPADAAAFLVARSGDEDLEGAAHALAMELGCLPLALEQAGAYVEENRTTLAAYLDAFRVHRAQLLREGAPRDYPAPVATAWELSFRALETEAPSAAILLEFLAFLAADAIPTRLFLDYSEHLPESLAKALPDLVAFDRELARPLLHYSLVEREGESFSVHRLVQAVTRERMNPDERRERLAQVVSLLIRAFRFDRTEPAGWSWCARLLPHMLAAASHAEALQVTSNPMILLLGESGHYMATRAEYGQARMLFERALLISEGLYGPDHAQVGAILTDLSATLVELDELEAARTAGERAVRIGEAQLDPSDPQLAVRFNNLAGALWALRDLQAAKAAFERALSIDEGVYGPQHPEVAIDLSNLANVLLDLDELTEARTTAERALKILEDVFGSLNPIVGTAKNTLGLILKRAGELDAARTLFEQALEIDERVYGADHPKVGIRLSNLGVLLLEMGESAVARALLERATSILERSLGRSHTRTEIARMHLSRLDASLR